MSGMDTTPQYLGVGTHPNEAKLPHYEGPDGWCRCTCDGCAPFGCSHQSNPDTESCTVRFAERTRDGETP